MTQQARWNGKSAHAAEWTRHTMETLATIGAALVATDPSDVGAFCSGYSAWSAQQRAQFWTFLLSGVCEFESDFNASATYREDFNDSSGKPVVSAGLLQISFESANGRRYNCGLSRSEDLLDPLINLTCGVRIMQALVLEDGVISRTAGTRQQGAARYWSTLRANHPRHPLENIQHWCRNFAPEAATGV